MINLHFVVSFTEAFTVKQHQQFSRDLEHITELKDSNFGKSAVL